MSSFVLITTATAILWFVAYLAALILVVALRGRIGPQATALAATGIGLGLLTTIAGAALATMLSATISVLASAVLGLVSFGLLIGAVLARRPV